MTSRELIRWSRLHERRARGRAAALPIAIGGLLAAWVAWRSTAGAAAASHAWLAGTVVVYAVAFLRVPFHIYWRADAALLAQLPIEGRPLFDAAMVRCLRAAASTTGAVIVGALPLAAVGDAAMLVRHIACAGALGLAAGLLLPAVNLGAAALVVQGGANVALTKLTALGGAPARAAAGGRPPATSPGALLGALPGFAATGVFVAVLALTSWLAEAAPAPAPLLLGAIAGVSCVAGLAALAGAAVMALVLRDVSALDRQRLAPLEIKPPTRIEAAIARRLGEAGLAYRKDARLMRRRYPIAFALGGLVFVMLVIVGLARPTDATPWLMVAIGGAAAYGVMLAGRLRRPPIELARLSATLPLTAGALRRARLAWLLGWWSIFAGAPGLFAALRQSEPGIGLALVAGATIAMFVAGASPR